MNPTPSVVVSHVSKIFKRAKDLAPVEALRDVSLELPANTFVTLLGPSGCGKTTLLRMINGLIQPDSGEVHVFGKPPKPGPRIGFVFQSFRLIPWLNVRNNVGFGLSLQGVGEAERKERVDHYLKLVGLSRFADVYPHELSGGMKQRAALARALVTEPEILLMDEPFASLDAQVRELMQMEMMRLWSERRGIVLFVTHSVDEAIIMADKIALMGPRPGRIVETLDVPLPRPRWDDSIKMQRDYIELRRYLWDRIREMVTRDPSSDFYAGEPDKS